MHKGAIHIINSLDKISGAESALLRVVAEQSLRPLEVVTIAPSSKVINKVHGIYGDVMIKSFYGPFGYLGGMARLLVYLCRLQPSTVFCWMYRSNIIGVLVACLSKHQLVWNIRHSLSRLDKEPWRVRLSIYLNRILSWAPVKIIYNSNLSMRQHEDYGFPREKSVYVPNGFKKLERPQFDSSVKKNIFIIGHASRYSWEKDPETLVSAFSLARKNSKRNLKLLMAGRGYVISNNEFTNLLKKYALNDGSIQGLGEVSNMEEFYNSIDVFVLSSISEGFPNVLAESLMHGVPCITTDVGDANQIISSDSGWIVPPGDAKAMAVALLDAESLGKREIESRGISGWENMISRYSIIDIAKIYDNIGLIKW